MRDYGFDFSYSDKHCENLFARGFEFTPGDRQNRAVTAIDVLEHLKEPVEFVKKALLNSGADTFIFTTELYTGDTPPAVEDWYYYALETGQHIAFYSAKTLHAFARQLDMNFYSVKGLHIFSRRSVPVGRIRLLLHPLVEDLVAKWIRRRTGTRTMADHAAIKALLFSGSADTPCAEHDKTRNCNWVDSSRSRLVKRR